MGFMDKAKAKLTDAVDKNGDKIGGALDKAGDLADTRTGGKHTSKIDQGVKKAKDALDGLDRKKDDDVK
ncbi:antitoxin [Nocardioides gilvus]|uniref:antitoxin n=1 Tax=Nocardioides gilvus TaxID=1735589 RepID=UPI000D750ACC|nr:antitoxin [Nocardioides gilvus]